MAVYFESQTKFGDVPWPRKRSAGVFLDSAQSVADGSRLTARTRDSGGDDHKRTVDRQPKIAGEIPQAPIVESSSLE